MSSPLLEVRDFQAHFFTRRGIVRAVEKVSFDLFAGETLGIVGESGSGKSVCQMSLLRLLPEPPLRIVGGTARFRGEDLLLMPERKLRTIRGNKIAMIFQEPMTSLNPYLKVGTQLIEPLRIHEKITKKDADRRAIEALEVVGFSNPTEALKSYPHEFSGGMRQRVMIAMALTTRPDILIADEPTTALDVTIQAQILALLKKIQTEIGMAIILITHDLGVIASLADRVAIMYAGRILETGSVDEIFYSSRHPYTKALLDSTPRLDDSRETLPPIQGSPPDLSTPILGCPFVPRCPHRFDPCELRFPDPTLLTPSHRSYCHLDGRSQ